MQCLRIAKAYPVNKNWLDTFRDRVISNNFSGKRLEAAVSQVIDKHTFGSIPNYGEFLSYDRKIEVYTEWEMGKLEKSEGAGTRRFYEGVEIEGVFYYTLKENVKKYNLKLWKPEEHRPIAKKKTKDDEGQRLETAAILRKTIESLKDKDLGKTADKKNETDYKSSGTYKTAKKEFEEALRKVK